MKGTMCGRFILLTDLSVIVKSFDIREVVCDYRPGNNISPGQEITAFVHIVAQEKKAAWIDSNNHNQKEPLSILKPYPDVTWTYQRQSF